VKRVVVSVEQWGKIYRENTYCVHDEQSRDAVLIDPGKPSSSLEEYIRRSNLKVRAILNTHGHFDHIGGNDHYRKLYGVKVYAHKADRHFYGKSKTPDKPDVLLDKEKSLTLGTLKFTIIHVPGHSRGSLFFLIHDHLFSGDTLFLENVGMTFSDKKSSSAQKMRLQIEGLKTKILVLPPSVKVYPGHGPQTTVGHEKQFNPRLTRRSSKPRAIEY